MGNVSSHKPVRLGDEFPDLGQAEFAFDDREFLDLTSKSCTCESQASHNGGVDNEHSHSMRST